MNFTKQSIGSSLKKAYILAKLDSSILISFILTICICAAGLIFLLVVSKALPSQVPIYYSLPRGTEQLASSVYLVILPLGGLLILFLNTIFMLYLISKEILLARFLMISATVCSFLLVYTLVRIILLIA